MDLSIIIINWNSIDFLVKCISSIRRETHHLEYEIIVVDNGSFDGCGDTLKTNAPDVIFVQSNENVGFAKANNLGFQKSTGRYLLFLNPDTELNGPAINILLQTAEHLPRVGVLGARLLNRDHTVQTSCIQAFPTITNQILDAELLRRWFPYSRLWGVSPLLATSDVPSQVDAISGACMLIERTAFETIGHFSEEYFMYSEDVDVCYKCHSVGLRNYYVPGAEITHYGGGSNSKGTFGELPNVIMRESRWRFFKKSKGIGYALLYRVSMALAATARLGLIALNCFLNTLVRKTGSFAKQSEKWMAIFCWAIGMKNGRGAPDKVAAEVRSKRGNRITLAKVRSGSGNN